MFEIKPKAARKINPEKQCKHIKENKEQCGSPKKKGIDYCISHFKDHEPKTATDAKEEKKTKKKKEKKPVPPQLVEDSSDDSSDDEEAVAEQKAAKKKAAAKKAAKKAAQEAADRIARIAAVPL